MINNWSATENVCSSTTVYLLIEVVGFIKTLQGARGLPSRVGAHRTGFLYFVLLFTT